MINSKESHKFDLGFKYDTQMFKVPMNYYWKIFKKDRYNQHKQCLLNSTYDSLLQKR